MGDSKLWFVERVKFRIATVVKYLDLHVG